MITKRLLLGLVFAAIACAPGEESANSDSLAAIDTLKAATETLPTRDSVPGATQTKTGTPPNSTKTSSGTKTKRDSIIGHDSVTPFDPKKPRLDTVKKKP